MRSSPSLLAFCWALSISAQTDDRSLYLLHVGEGWCGFGTERLWTIAKESVASAPLVARVDYSNGRVAFVYVTDADETGDWTTFDKYSFDRSEVLTGLERTIRMAEGLSEEQVWTIKNGEAIKQKSTRRNIVSKQVLSDDSDVWFPIPLVITRAQDFPFWQLVRDKRQEILSTGRFCLTVNRLNR